MSRLFGIPLMLTVMLALAGCGGGGPADEKIRTQIEGEWVAIEGTSNGEPAPKWFLGMMTLEFKDGKFRMNHSMRMDYTIDTSKSPARIDIKNSMNQVGIVKMEDGKLHLCTGTGGSRPTEFKSKAGTDQTYLVLKAKK
jgi:uncharacterized protein (TIGR03067 family)